VALKVILLGTGDAFGSGGCGHSAVAVVHGGRTILLDCGANLLPAADKVGLDLTGLVAVCLTHAHGDHIAGWPFLRLYYQFLHPRSEPLSLVGPPGVDRVLEQLATLLYPELDTGGRGYEVIFHAVSDGSTVAVADAELQAVSVTHQRDHPAVGYRLSWGGRTVAFSGDTTWSEALVELAAEADLFVCECNDLEGATPVHLSYRQLEANADRFTCRRLVLTHCGPEVLAHQDELAWPVGQDGQLIEL